MNLSIHPLTLLLALLGGAGVLIIWVARVYEPPVKLTETEALFGTGRRELSLVERLQTELDKARIQITAAEFLRLSLILAVLASLAMYILTDAVLPAIVGFALGGASYWLYLSNKASQAEQEYDDQMPQVVARLITGAKLGQGIAGAAEHVAKFGPPNCREDWAYIASQVRGRSNPKDIEQIFRTVSERRNSQLLNAILEMLLIVGSGRGKLTELLPRIQESLEERTRMMRQARTKLGAPIRELWIVCAAPFAGVLVFRFLSPANGAAYSSPLGQIIIFVGWSLDIVVFILGYRSLSDALRKELSFHGALKAEPRPELMSVGGPGGEKKVQLNLPGEAPTALSGVVRRGPPPPPPAGGSEA
jgi:Flp pilus assembly protein TadB